MKYTDEELSAAINCCTSIRQVLLHLGVVAKGGNYATVRRKAARLGLSLDHFYDYKINLKPYHPAPVEQLFIANSGSATATIRTKILREKLLDYVCAKCALGAVWQNLPLTLELDHINGLSNDHRLANLRFLCPNCHAQTPTFRNKSRC